MSFRGDILTIGTGTGSILFYDIRTSKYMVLKDKTNVEIVFKTNTGWVVINPIFQIFSFFFKFSNRFGFNEPGSGRIATGHDAVHASCLHTLLRRKWDEIVCGWRPIGRRTSRQLRIRLELIGTPPST